MLLRSIISSINSPITIISNFLDKLIRPLFDKHVRSATIIDGIDLIRRLETYNENGYLKPTSQLCGAMGSAFTLTLANIFMWKWEKVLVQQQLAANEIYGRYIDDIFLTSNESLETINQMLDEANKFHPNIKLVRQIGTSVSFLDIFIENKNGVLATSVYHKEAAEPYIVPFTSDHPRYVFTSIIDGALTRAIRYSSTLSAFNEERRSIKLMLLYNGYPPRYIHSRFMKFFTDHIPTTTFLPSIGKDYLFTLIRNFLLNKPTAAAHGVASRIANATDTQNTGIIEDSLVRLQLSKKSKWIDNIIIHYTHEARLHAYEKAVHQLWHQMFTEIPVMNTKLIIGNRNNPKNKSRLSQCRPRTHHQK